MKCWLSAAAMLLANVVPAHGQERLWYYVDRDDAWNRLPRIAALAWLPPVV